ncbi:putative SERF-like protein [Zancudomyces culisetae]|uniref:Putative SERF-like protein n=1 Tax=Zancudomyces culisetae TaxID=1213189 RepID=A0A1R1PT08_ZANCU|nr:putative SERF-like protein [Zancudomyces culisetae]|eukprot:OMH84100.1 putative SERF-like protein [Zancudomyces culisetae]
MTRGNQRDLAREKNRKKLEKLAKGQKKDDISLTSRKERDAEIMRQKQLKKQQEKEAGSASSTSQSKPK